MKKKINDQEQQAKKVRGFYGAVDKVGNFVRKWGLPVVGVIALTVFRGNSKDDKS